MRIDSFKRWATRFPLYPWILAATPAVQLLAENILEVEISAAFRPILLSLAAVTLGLTLFAAILKDRYRAALLVSLLTVLFFSYGHLYQFLRANTILGLSLGRHRFLIAFFGLASAASLWLTWVRRPNLAPLTPWFNLLAAVMLAAPVVRIAAHEVRTALASRAAEELAESMSDLEQIASDDLPDVYYIILDGYMRSDALKRDLGYDNSAFLEALEGLGFYVASCSRSNYAETLSSLTSSLNMAYIPQLRASLSEQGLSQGEIFTLLKRSLVRSRFEELGYQTIAFQTGFDWSDMRDVDIYLSVAQKALDLRRISPFEILMLETTAVKILLDGRYLLSLADIDDPSFRHRAHMELQWNILAQLPEIASIPGPTYTFAHILIPHTPYVFDPHGKVRSDPGFYSGERSEAIDEDYQRRGYTGQVAFISSQILEIVEAIIEDSEIPPILIIQGDHGLEGDNRLMILNAYYLAGEGKTRLYPSISPVNTFRLIFDAYFGTSYGLLADRSFAQGDPHAAVPETAPECQTLTQ